MGFKSIDYFEDETICPTLNSSKRFI